MANRYWVGGTGTWNSVSTANWAATTGGASGASAPTSDDIVFIDANSGGGTITLDADANIVRLDARNSTVNIDWNSYKISINGSSTTVWYSGGITAIGSTEAKVEFTYSGANSRTINLRSGVGENGAISVYVTAGTGSFTISTGSTGVMQNLNFTGFSGALLPTTPTASWTIYGNLTLSSTMTMPSQTGSLVMLGTSGTQQITTAGKTLDFPVTQNGVGGTVQLQDALTMGSTRTFNLTAGTLDLNNLTLATGLFSSSNSNIRSILFGATGQINLIATSGTLWTTSASTGFNTTGTNKNVTSPNGAAGTRTFNFGSIAENIAMSVSVTSGADTVSLQGRYLSLNTTGFTGTIAGASRSIYGSLTIGAGATYAPTTTVTSFIGTSGSHTITVNGVTIDGAITFDGPGGAWAFADALTQGAGKNFIFTNGTVKLKNSATNTVGAFTTSGTNQKFLQSTLAGSQATLSQVSGTVDTSYLTIKDINATGGATWNSFVDQNNVDAGNNEGWDFGISPVIGGTEYTYQLRSFTQPRRF